MDKSYYNSTNSQVLATHVAAGGNVRMLLYKPHPATPSPDGTAGWEPARREFVIGSYFEALPHPDGTFDYEWSWGNYFSDISDAVAYWDAEVLHTGRPDDTRQ